MTNYSILLTTGWRADCSGNRIGQAMRTLAKDRPELIPIMTSTYLTYINGSAPVYAWKQNDESVKALATIKREGLKP